MSSAPAKLTLVCGKAASGKSTLAARLAGVGQTVLIAEDPWLAPLFGDEMTTLSDYVRCAEKLRAVMGPHVVALLQKGISVVLDFPANTPETRTWMLGLAREAGVAAELHFLDLPDDLCKSRLRVRNASGAHPFTLTDAQFDQLARHFVSPTEDEGFTLIRHHPGAGD